jgi:SAM-dependent methyltransferase
MNAELYYKIYWKLQSILAPGLKFSQDIYEEVLNEHCTDAIKWLDLGCGHNLLSPWRLEQENALTSKAKLLVGIDFDYLSLTKHKTIRNKLRGSITVLPFPDNTFDLITSNMVFEHLDDPEKQLKEISRVLVKGGKLIFHTPNSFGYSTVLARMIPGVIKDKLVYILQGREEDDVFPAYYRINSRSRIRKVALASGFNVLQLRMICTTAQLVVLPPIVVLELLWIRFLMSRMGKLFRTNIITTLEKA